MCVCLCVLSPFLDGNKLNMLSREGGRNQGGEADQGSGGDYQW